MTEITNSDKKIVIAIDGPSGTGKSSTAKLLAKKLNYTYIDSGAIYRAFTLNALRNDLKPSDVNKIVDLAKSVKLEFNNDEIYMNGTNISKEIRSLEVTNKVSAVSKIREIRKLILDMLRTYSKENNIIMDGRDIGTVVFPNADFKFYFICDMKTRAARRQQDFRDMGFDIPLEKVIKELQIRDQIDTTRAEAPLKKAKDAIEIDSTNMIIEEQVDCLYRKVTNTEIPKKQEQKAV
jgi:cytidylate kinase